MKFETEKNFIFTLPSRFKSTSIYIDIQFSLYPMSLTLSKSQNLFNYLGIIFLKRNLKVIHL